MTLDVLNPATGERTYAYTYEVTNNLIAQVNGANASAGVTSVPRWEVTTESQALLLTGMSLQAAATFVLLLITMGIGSPRSRRVAVLCSGGTPILGAAFVAAGVAVWSGGGVLEGACSYFEYLQSTGAVGSVVCNTDLALALAIVTLVSMVAQGVGTVWALGWGAADVLEAGVSVAPEGDEEAPPAYGVGTSRRISLSAATTNNPMRKGRPSFTGSPPRSRTPLGKSVLQPSSPASSPRGSGRGSRRPSISSTSGRTRNPSLGSRPRNPSLGSRASAGSITPTSPGSPGSKRARLGQQGRSVRFSDSPTADSDSKGTPSSPTSALRAGRSGSLLRRHAVGTGAPQQASRR